MKTIPLMSATLLLALLVSTAQGTDLTYQYDDLGRLTAVNVASTESAIYTYDMVGNLTAIAPQASGGGALNDTGEIAAYNTGLQTSDIDAVGMAEDR